MEVKATDLSPIFSENVIAKIVQVAQKGLKCETPLQSYPHTVPQHGQGIGKYEEREAEFWTCGFFPGSIYVLLERAVKFPRSLNVPKDVQTQLPDSLLQMGRHLSVAINQMAGRTDTHDMGFIVQPALQKDWELTGNKKSLHSVVKAAYALASRYDERVKAIRSWDVAVNNRYSITDMETNYLVIIDSMCNLDLLYFVGNQQNDQSLINLATTHANTVMSTLLRPNFSSYHLVNFDPRSGKVQAKLTNQGWDDESTWSRGQAWSILGFAQTYTWTKDIRFLETAIKCACYFLKRLGEGKHQWHHPFVPTWDFDAPQDIPQEPLRDVSAGVIAANGLFLIHQSLQSLPDSTSHKLLSSGENLLLMALMIIHETLDMSLDRDLASFGGAGLTGTNGKGFNEDISIRESGFDAILRNSTANNNEHAHKPYRDHGLVYADYYLLEFGNKLLRASFL